MWLRVRARARAGARARGGRERGHLGALDLEGVEHSVLLQEEVADQRGRLANARFRQLLADVFEVEDVEAPRRLLRE